MLEQLPELVDPLLCAEKRRSFKGEVALSALPRLADVLADTVGMAAVTMAFDKRERLAVVEGHVSAVVRLICQNCLETFDWPVNHDFKLAIVASPEAVRLVADPYEPLIVSEDKIPLKDIVEEELLLLLPAFPRHAEGNCGINQIRCGAAGSEQNERLRSDNPFSVLAKLKNTGDS
ncbi:MAG: YceD family protein [Gammaproteobacteria bacterium]